MPSPRAPRRLVAALTLALLALSAVGSSQTADPSAIAFSTPVQVGRGAEPSIFVDPSGSPYYAVSADNIWRSDDQGATWKRITPRQFLAGDANAAVGSTGTLYYQILWVGSSWAYTSFDHGETWTYETAFSTQPYVDRNWIAAYGADVVYSKADIFAGPQTPIVYKSTDSGATFQPTTSIVDGLLSPSGGIKGPIVVDPNSGVLYLPSDWATNVMVSRDGGAHFHYAPVPNPYGESYDVIINLAVDAAGNAYLAWISPHGGAWTLQYSVSTDEGASWSVPKIVATGGASRAFPWIAAGEEGEVVLAWYETTSPTTLASDDVPNDMPWRVRVAHVEDAHEASPTVRLASATGVVHRGKICTLGVECASGTRDLLDFLGVAIDPSDGRIVVVYTDDEGRPPTVMFVRQTA